MSRYFWPVMEMGTSVNGGYIIELLSGVSIARGRALSRSSEVLQVDGARCLVPVCPDVNDQGGDVGSSVCISVTLPLCQGLRECNANGKLQCALEYFLYGGRCSGQTSHVIITWKPPSSRCGRYTFMLLSRYFKTNKQTNEGKFSRIEIQSRCGL